MEKIAEQTLAFAGIVQACELVQSIARKGDIVDIRAERATVQSILQTDPDSVVGVFGGIGGVATGLQFVRDRLAAAPDPIEAEVLRYMHSLIALQKNLLADSAKLGKLTDRMDWLKTLDTEEIYSACAELYSETISQMQPRILVQGEAGYLEREDIAAKVRTYLLAGLRSAVLWRQQGGRRLQLFFRRSAYQTSASELLRLAKSWDQG